MTEIPRPDSPLPEIPATRIPGRRESAHSAILDWVEQRLRTGQLVSGDRLPGERALAEQFGVSRSSVREALRVLDALGLVRSGVGSGPRAGAVVVSEPSAALAWALRMHVATRALPIGDIVDMRVLLETEAMRASSVTTGAARREILERAGGLLVQMEQDQLPDARFHDLDVAFHVALSELGGNTVGVTILESLRTAIIGYVSEGVSRVEDWPGLRGRLCVEHRAIHQAASRGEAQVAADLLRRHILDFRRSVPLPE